MKVSQSAIISGVMLFLSFASLLAATAVFYGIVAYDKSAATFSDFDFANIYRK